MKTVTDSAYRESVLSEAAFQLESTSYVLSLVEDELLQVGKPFRYCARHIEIEHRSNTLSATV